MEQTKRVEVIPHTADETTVNIYLKNGVRLTVVGSAHQSVTDIKNIEIEADDFAKVLDIERRIGKQEGKKEGQARVYSINTIVRRKSA